jgi:hypothetical protein
VTPCFGALFAFANGCILALWNNIDAAVLATSVLVATASEGTPYVS